MNSKEPTGANASTIKELGAVILSLEGEITDRNIETLEKEVERLDTLWEKDKILGAFVKIIGALGRYIGSKRADAHEDAIPTINSVFTTLEKVIHSPDMPPAQKRALAAGELEKFNALKKKLAARAEKRPEKDAAPGAPADASTIAALKAVILSLEWEISDDTIFTLEKEIDRLKSLWGGHKVHLAFLQIIQVVSKYVGAKRADAHADSISLLHSVFSSLESMVMNPHMPVQEQQEILQTELGKFNDLKKQIAAGAPSSAEKEAERAGAFKPAGIEPDSARPEIPPVYPLDQEQGAEEQEMGEKEALPPALSHVEKPEGSGFDTLRAYEVKPLTEVNTRLDAFFDEVPEPAPSGPSPMDDLFGSHEVSPADELLQEIHLQVLGEGDDAPDRKAQAPKGAADSPDVREYIPTRKEGEPFAEIDNRLDEFFDEDEPTSDSALAENGEGVVSYRAEDASSPAGFDSGVTPAVTGLPDEPEGIAPEFETPPPEPGGIAPELETAAPEPEEITPDFETAYPEPEEVAPDIETPAPEPGGIAPKSETAAPEPEGISPFQFEDEFFEEEAEPEAAVEQPVSDREEQPLERLRAAIRKLGKSVDKLTTEDIYKEIAELEEQWKDEPERLLYLKLLNSLILYIGMMGTESKKESLELLHRTHEKLEQTVTGEGEQLPLFDVMKDHIDLQDQIVQELFFSLSRYQYGGEEIPAGDEPPGLPEESTPDRLEERESTDLASLYGDEEKEPREKEEQPRKPGLWSRIRNLFGAGKS